MNNNIYWYNNEKIAIIVNFIEPMHNIYEEDIINWIRFRKWDPSLDLLIMQAKHLYDALEINNN